MHTKDISNLFILLTLSSLSVVWRGVVQVVFKFVGEAGVEEAASIECEHGLCENLCTAVISVGAPLFLYVLIVLAV